MLRHLCVLALCLSVTLAQSPNCQPTSGISFVGLTAGYCPQMTQLLNGVNSGTFDFYFNWCSTGSQESCPAGYVVQGSANSCDRSFISWTTGMAYNAQTQMVAYVVSDTTGSTASITVTCNPNGAAGAIGCPSSYNVAGTGPYQYSLSLTSKSACVGAGPGPGPSPPGPPGAPGSTDSTSGLTGGGAFLIIFFVGSFLYLALGFAYNFKVKGLQGMEALPNIEFWKDFPTLVKDGCVFFSDWVRSLRGGGTGSGGGYTPA